MQRISRRAGVAAVSLAAVAAATAATVVVVPQAMASARPVVTGLSTHQGPYWGGRSVTITGSNFTDLQQVKFGSQQAWSVQVVSPTKLVVTEPYHGYDKVYVRVYTDAGVSSRGSASAFTFTRPSMNDPIQGGLTGNQEQTISRQIRAHHRGVHLAPRSRRWTPAMGRTAVARAASYLGVPYSWAGGSGSGPTTGVCAHNGGDLDCHIVGFDCSGLTLYSWWPYIHLDHYAMTQHRQAGRFHPTIGQLVPGDLVYFTGYIPGGIGHTAIYAGHGMVIEAPQSGSVVRRSQLADVIAGDGGWRGATRPLTSGRMGAGPQVTAVTKTVSANGGVLSIWGQNLTGTTSIHVGGQTLYTFHAASSRHLTVRVPAHSPGTAKVSVSNAWGTAQRTFTYAGVPTISSLSDSSGPTAGANIVIVHGRYLDHVTKATVDNASVALRLLSPYRAAITMPAHAAGDVQVQLISAFGASNPLNYQFVAPAGTTPPSTSPRKTTSRPSDTASPAPTTSSTSPTTSTVPSPVTTTSGGASGSAAPSGSATSSAPSGWSSSTGSSSTGSSSTGSSSARSSAAGASAPSAVPSGSSTGTGG